jgi:putative phosphonate metabolism protein
MTARYAIYYAPSAATPLWDKASAWLGRDAYADAPRERPALPALADLDLDALTADPRGYGFHATLKAPFELAEDATQAELLAAVRAVSGGLAAFEVPIAPAALGRFLAFRLQASSPEMEALHGLCVREFDAFRRPLSDFDLARRRKAPLTPEQDQRLVAWGYPYVFEDFRFHMTLTGQIRDEALRERVLGVLQDHFAPETGRHRFDGLAVFKQADRDAPFTILERADFAPTAAAVRA